MTETARPASQPQVVHRPGTGEQWAGGTVGRVSLVGPGMGIAPAPLPWDVAALSQPWAFVN